MLPAPLSHELARAHQADLRREAARPGDRPRRRPAWWLEAGTTARRHWIEVTSAWRPTLRRQACPSC